MADTRVPVIYILSSGRSGSTLLDLLLGSHPNLWTLGEAEMLPWELRRGKYPCGCGEPLSTCGFWSQVVPKIPLHNTYHIGYFRDIRGWGKLIRGDLLGDLVRNRTSRRWQAAVREYGEVNYQYFKVAKDTAEVYANRSIRWLVDASKNPYRLFWLHQSGLFKLRVIHLVKDPRGFSFSILKEYPRRTLKRALRAGGRWFIENLLFERLLKGGFAADEVFFLRYEDLAGKPEESLARLSIWLGIDFPQNILEDFRSIRNHAISGNPMRWRKEGIYLDQKWRSALPKVYKQAVWLVTWPLARRYGYHR